MRSVRAPRPSRGQYADSNPGVGTRAAADTAAGVLAADADEAAVSATRRSGSLSAKAIAYEMLSRGDSAGAAAAIGHGGGIRLLRDTALNLEAIALRDKVVTVLTAPLLPLTDEEYVSALLLAAIADDVAALSALIQGGTANSTNLSALIQGGTANSTNLTTCGHGHGHGHGPGHGHGRGQGQGQEQGQVRRGAGAAIAPPPGLYALSSLPPI